MLTGALWTFRAALPIAAMTDQTPLSTTFSDRAALRAHVMSLSPSCGQAGDHPRPDIAAGSRAAEAALATIDPRAYAASRNHLDGAVTGCPPISGMAFSAWMKCGRGAGVCR